MMATEPSGCARNDHHVFADVAQHVVAGLGDLGLVPHHDPGAGEEPVELEAVDLGVRQHPQVDLAALVVDELAEHGAVHQHHVALEAGPLVNRHIDVSF